MQLLNLAQKARSLSVCAGNYKTVENVGDMTTDTTYSPDSLRRRRQIVSKISCKVYHRTRVPAAKFFWVDSSEWPRNNNKREPCLYAYMSKYISHYKRTGGEQWTNERTNEQTDGRKKENGIIIIIIMKIFFSFLTEKVVA